MAIYAADIVQEASGFAEGLPHMQGIPILLLNDIDETTTPVRMSLKLADLVFEAELIEFENVTHMGSLSLN